MYFNNMRHDFRQGKANSLLVKMAKKKISEILEDLEADTYKEEEELLKLQDYNIWNIYEENNMTRQMTVEFNKYLIRASEALGGIDVSKYTVYNFLCMNEMLQEKNKNNG